MGAVYLSRSVWCAPGAALVALAACAGSVDGAEPLRRSDYSADGGVMVSDDAPAGSGSSSSSSSSGAPQAMGGSACSKLAERAEGILTQYCASCHSGGNKQGGFGDVLDVEKLVAQGKVVPKQPDDSKLFMLVMAGTMPRTNEKPSADEIDALGAWIACGARDWNTPSAGGAQGQAAYLSIDQRLLLMYEDLRGIANPADRERMRYIDLSHFSNAGSGGGDVDLYRQSVSLLVNSLSTGNRVIAPEPIDPDQLLYRIDLRNYGWSERTWDLITAEYPYAVRYDPDSRLFPFDEDLADSIREDTQTLVPYIQADWFLAHASAAPLYYDILGFPANILELARDVGVDVNEEIEDSQVARAGFASSGVSVNNRVIERHEQPGFGGAFWLSYDFSSSEGEQNIFANPTDFRQEAGEGFFNLPNGLQAYFIQDAAFDRVDKADPAVVTDPHSRDRAVSPGLSCLGGCHLNQGVIAKDDELREYIRGSGPDAATRERTFELYPAIDEMRALMQADSERYLDAVSETGYEIDDENAINLQVRTHQDVLDAADVAATLGITEEELLDAISASPQTFPEEVVTLRGENGTIYRDTLDEIFDEVVEGLGLGRSIRRSNVSRQPAPAAANPAPTPASTSTATPAATPAPAATPEQDGDGRRR
jgi:mono/diheme cytochrome c family protein